MDAQAAIIASKLTRVREMRDEIARLRAENARLRDEAATLRAHFDLALLAAADLAARPPTGRFLLVDGWNLILGAGARLPDAAPAEVAALRAASPDALLARVRAHLAAHPEDFAWVVFDGPRENAFCDGRLRVSYTGGEGGQRADRFICDFLRMARWRGQAAPLVVVTADKLLLREAMRLLRP